ncbi:MAG: hypothetical protein GC131_06140 [Alphaproteobacteria bacterium]|nr:hypothetical protein [Alphaproteobacteria bacterium]
MDERGLLPRVSVRKVTHKREVNFNDTRMMMRKMCHIARMIFFKRLAARTGKFLPHADLSAGQNLPHGEIIACLHDAVLFLRAWRARKPEKQACRKMRRKTERRTKKYKQGNQAAGAEKPATRAN